MQARLLTYAHLDSPIHRMDGRWKLAALTLAMIATVCLRTIPAVAISFAMTLLLLMVARMPARWYLGRLGGIGVFLCCFLILLPLTMPERSLTLGPIRFSEQGLKLAAVILLKALTFTALTLLLLASTPFDILAKSAYSLRIPGILVQLAVLAYRFLFLFWDELHKLRIALRVRGYRNRMATHSYRTIGHVTGTLLVRSYERSERVGQAMRCRGFDGSFRTLHEFRTCGTDCVIFVTLVLLLIAVPLAVEFKPWTVMG